ncbi:pPIWI_RE module domain-containing protein [Spirosoma fluviale]|uniref:DUF3893 domain-containing protein n=1 Tax=Spirosoma fluviale TaxID=1597977 RepID=A0A286G1B1_9BACT|nr:DUF3962 domain-containing protein [Spirosoma fluviale]SOD89283.1 protein of unknown function [Spirosoma fluviale]
MKYQNLQPLAFQPINFDSVPALSYHTLSFPERWYKELTECWKETRKNKNQAYVSLPVKSLNESVLALIPDLVYVKNPTFTDKVWLYSIAPIKTDYLLVMVKAWAITCLVDVEQDALQTVLDSFQSNELRWVYRTLSGGWQQEENGTAKPAGEYYNLLPYQLAADLTTQPLVIGGRKMVFKRCPMGIGTSGAELVSWPPMAYVYGKKKQTYYYSISLRITLQTVAFQTNPLIYVHVGVRRYISQNISFKGDIKSAFIHTPLSWLPGLVYENSVQIARVRSRANGKVDKDGKKEYELQWDDTLEAIINKLNLSNPLPPAQELLNQLPTYSFQHTEALLIHSTSISAAHPISVGLSATDKTAIIDTLKQRLSANWTPLGAYPRINTQPKLNQKNPFVPVKALFSEATLPQRQARIEDAVGQQTLSLRIIYQKESTRNALIRTLESCLGFSYEPQTETYKIGKCTLRLHIEQIGAIASELDNKETSKSTLRQRHAYFAAKATRLEEIRQHLPTLSDDQPAVGVLMELANNFDTNKDPKEALRQGMARVGYLTQFISAEAKLEDTLEHRAQRAVLDLLRQLGVLSCKPAFAIKGHSLPTPLHIFGLWIVRQNSRFLGRLAEFPLLLHIHPDTGKISVKLPNSTNKWVSYARAQRELACMDACVMEHPTQMNHIRDFLAKLPANALLITHAQKLRGIWKSIANSKLTLDTVDTRMGGESGQLGSLNPGLRLVRIREEGANEAPQVFAINEDVVGLSSGVFAMTDRVFASVGQKPGTATKAVKNASKLNSWTDSTGKIQPPNPTKYVWNHRVCEITVAAIQPEDNPAHWAAITHELRSLSLQFNDTTMLPLPLQLASLLEEYVTE